MQRNLVLVNDLFKSKGSAANSMTDRASVHTGNDTEQFLHRNGTLIPLTMLWSNFRNGAKIYPVQCIRETVQGQRSGGGGGGATPVYHVSTRCHEQSQTGGGGGCVLELERMEEMRQAQPEKSSDFNG